MAAVWLVALLSILRINVLHATNCTLQTKIVGSGNTAVCAGDRLTFTCNASSSSTTQERWIGSNWGGDQVTLSVSDSLGTSLLRANNVFNVSFVSKTPFITKVEVANATLDLNGITVTCQETTNGATFVEVGTGCIIMAAPPSDPVAAPTFCTLNSVTLQWNGPLFDGGSNLTNYTLTSDPPTSNCNRSCSLDPTAQQYSFSGLQPGVPYTLGVSGSNCRGTQQGIQSTFNVTIPSPQAPRVCSVFDATANLTNISTTWYPLRISNSLLCGPVSTYNVTYAGPNGTDIYSIPAASCSSNCSHLYTVGAKTSSSQYSVSVAGFGVLTTMNTIVSTNNIFKVDVVNWTRSAAINCTFLSGLVDTSGCVVSFGTSPDYLPYTLTSSLSGGSGQSISIPLVINGSPLDLHTSYFYTASLSSATQCVTIRGSWCGPRALGDTSSLECACSNGSFGLQIPNGCACFTGVVPGSQASAECDNRSRRVGTGTPLCRPDGSWSAALPSCSLLTTTPPVIAAGNGVPVGIIVGIVVGSVVGFVIIVALVVVLAVVVVLMVLKFRSEEQAPKHGGVHIIVEEKPGMPSHDYALAGVPHTNPPPPRSIYSNEKNDHEWAAIMSVVKEAERH